MWSPICDKVELERPYLSKVEDEETENTVTIKISDLQTPKFVSLGELAYEKAIELEDQVKIINKKLDEILGNK